MKSGQPIAIDGNLVDVKNVNTHKCVRLVIDVPAERAASIIAVFGWPTMVDPVPVAVARLVVPDNVVQIAARPRGERSWSDMSLAQQAGIRCNEPAFWTFLREIGESSCNDAEAAAAYVRLACGGLHSRSELDKNSAAARKWRDMDRSYRAWLQAAEVV